MRDTGNCNVQDILFKRLANSSLSGYPLERQTDVIRKSGNNMGNIVYREAGIDDAEEMISYLNIVGGESDNLMHGPDGFNAPVGAVRQRIQAAHDADNSVILIALAGKEIIARAELAGCPGPRLRHNARFSISVRKDCWNRKIGTRLMTEIIERARKMNLLNIELEVVADNKAAIALYHKMGFSDVGVYRNYWFANNAYSDAIVMQKCLDD